MQEDTLDFLKELSKSCSHGSIHGNDCLNKIHTNVISMLSCRGYTQTVSNCETVDDLFAKMKAGEAILVGKGQDQKRDTYIFFCIEYKVGIKFLRSIVEKLSKVANACACIVSIDGPTTFTKKDARDNQYDTQFMTFKQLFNDISKHHLFRNHRALNDAEKREVMANYNIQHDSQLPQLLQKDPAVIFYHFRKGDVIEITRNGGGGQEGTFYYRIVV